MRTLHVIGGMDPISGGPCQVIRNLVPELEKRGIQNEVVSLDDPTATFLGQDPFPIHTFGPAKGAWKYTNNLISWLLKNLSRFDTIIIHGLWQYHSYAVRKAVNQYRRQLKSSACGKAKIPRLFVMPHGMLDPYFQKAPGRKLKAIRNWIYWKLIEEKVVNKADAMLFTCEAELQLAREPFRPYQPKKEFNVGLGVSKPPEYEPEMRSAFLKKCPEVQEHSYLLFLSRIHEKKGVDLLIKAYAEIHTKEAKYKEKILSVTDGSEEITDYQEVNTKLPKLVIAGPGLESPYGKYLIDLVSKSEALRNSVFFPGMLSGPSKWGAFYGCEAFILPSHQENFGIAIVEALACGKPVLISNQVNIWKEIETTGAGIVADDSLNGTIKVLEEWQSSSILQKQYMSKQATQCYERLYSIESVSQRWIECILK